MDLARVRIADSTPITISKTVQLSYTFDVEKFDSSKAFKISTYVYWWIRQGVSRALVENSRTLLLPTHLHERLGLIKNAKVRFEEKRITPSIDRIAESLNMSKKKVRKLLRTNYSVKHKPHLHHDKSTHSTGATI